VIAKIFGWNVKVNTDKLKVFEVEFQYEYQYHVLVEYIRKGDYRSNIPFGLFQKEGKFYLIATKKPEFIYILDNPVQKIKEVDFKDDLNEGLDIFVLTFFYCILISFGYTRPIEVKSLVGRSKGYVSFRKKPEKIIEHEFLGRKISYSISIAERFETHLNEFNEVFVFYDPRHEISESFFNLTSDALIPEEVKKEKKELVRKFKQVEERFERISKMLRSYETKIIEIEELNELKAFRTEFPLVDISGNKIKDQCEKTPYEEIVKSFIKLDSFCDKLPVLIDNTSTCIHDEDIDQFLMEFEKKTGIITEKITFSDPEYLSDFSIALIILDDQTKGYEFVYNSIKKKISMVSKVVKISTILNESWEDIIILSWMSLRFRYSNNLLMKLENSTFKNVIALDIIPILGGNWLILSGTYMNKNLVKSRMVLFYNEKNEQVILNDDVEKFLDKLLIDDYNSETLIIIGNPDLKPYLQNIVENHNWDLVYLKESNSLFFSIQNGLEPIPLDGLFVNISNSKYLLMTNGFPNKPEGIPKPIIIEIIHSNVEKNQIIKDIFGLTFIHAMSFSKPKFPFPLALARANVSDHNIQMIEDFNLVEEKKIAS